MMGIFSALAGIMVRVHPGISLLVLAYLLYALFRGERF